MPIRDERDGYDDKIILRARRNHLLQQFASSSSSQDKEEVSALPHMHMLLQIIGEEQQVCLRLLRKYLLLK